MITVLAGGVGAARLLRGMVRAVPASDVTAIVNTADDVVLHGLHVSPDLDTVTYTLAEAGNPETGWGLAGETWQAMDALERLGGHAWFRLGDRDLGTHLHRTGRLAEGAGLAAVTAEIAAAWGLELTLLPMTEDRVATMVTLARCDEAREESSEQTSEQASREVGFQEYFVRLGHSVAVESVRFDGAQESLPGPGVLDALADADVVVIAPSNPIVSIGPLLAVPGIAEALRSRRADTVAVSPIVAGAALKGPADRLMRELGHEASVVGVARLYRDLAATLVVDTADAGLADAVEAEGMACVVTDTIMSSAEVAADLSRRILEVSR
ncbi:MAG TPA: 2-phospho-L-lactate transferase [Acidimicrobiia bacterium]|nr:2-phospho-L-lactate transferase [Acidimicrobiales bacterium]HBA95021.1 2-phospho-L-lactate transferase [Acidimicrobiaceae bacterium]HIE68591.1 2-phospho-L-lactate transferase [Acidimicrobiia bacterium]HIL47492.1 2-phospho-L-lactate transferase [Acidimicrobiia bacterium]